MIGEETGREQGMVGDLVVLLVKIAGGIDTYPR